MSHEFEFYHGVALCRLIHHDQIESVKLYPSPGNASYIVNGEIGIYIKYSAKRMSPWRFTFKRDHQEEISEMKQLLHHEVYLVLVCGEDGIACLRFDEVKKILDHVHEDIEWVSVSRRPREKYTVCGHDGKLNFKISDSSFPAKLFTQPASERTS